MPRKRRASSSSSTNSPPPYTRANRDAAFRRLAVFIDDTFAAEIRTSATEFWGPFLERLDEVPNDLIETSSYVHQTWFAFSYRLHDGLRPVEHFLRHTKAIALGERAFLTAMRDSTMRFYEVIGVVPGASVTVRDVLDGTETTVKERSASQQLRTRDHLATRILPCGASGSPEFDGGILPIAPLLVDSVRDAAHRIVTRASREEDADSVTATIAEVLPVLFHETWLSSFFDPPVPELQNTDGEELIASRSRYTVRDANALRRALDGAAHKGVERIDDTRWAYVGPNPAGEPITLATLTLEGSVLTTESNSVERNALVRALVEYTAGDSVKFQATVHEDVRRMMQERIRENPRAAGTDDESPADENDPASAALVEQLYEKHYRAWIDEPVPALDGMTPRAAAKDRAMRPRVEKLLRELEIHCERSAARGQPAYDPSWMWNELGLRPKR